LTGHIHERTVTRKDISQKGSHWSFLLRSKTKTPVLPPNPNLVNRHSPVGESYISVFLTNGFGTKEISTNANPADARRTSSSARCASFSSSCVEEGCRRQTLHIIMTTVIKHTLWRKLDISSWPTIRWRLLCNYILHIFLKVRKMAGPAGYSASRGLRHGPRPPASCRRTNCALQRAMI
jgi:hypothetical protein